jgi:hypothetical protein
MITDRTDSRYFKLAVGSAIRKESISDISANCPLCGDKKGRLHLFQKDDMEVPLVKCFNGGCILEAAVGMQKFLLLTAPNLALGYKKEKFNEKIESLKEPEDLNNILKLVKKKTGVDRIEKRDDFELPKLFLDMLIPLQNVKEAKDFISNRCLNPDDIQGYFCDSDFVKIVDKNYYVKFSIF